jgi:hypothetical protein
MLTEDCKNYRAEVRQASTHRNRVNRLNRSHGKLPKPGETGF